MLEAITDFWKPTKKASQPNKIKLGDMQVGTVIGFGNMPQTWLSGRKLTVIAINSYQFGKDILTSFVLGRDKEADISMIVAEAQGEQYLALSRRLSPSDKMSLFEEGSIENITKKNDISTFSCRDNVQELKGWLVSSYKREIQGMKGTIYRKDLRDGNNTLGERGDEFQYTLLGSSSNEHAIEIESYNDKTTDVYATVYRRISDITEITHPEKSGAELKLSSDEEIMDDIATRAPVMESKSVTTDMVVGKENASGFGKKEEKATPKLEAIKMDLMSLPELIITKPALETAKVESKKPEETKSEPAKVDNAVSETKTPEKLETKKTDDTKITTITNQKNNNEEKKDMSLVSTISNENKTTTAGGIDLPSVPSFSSSTKDLLQKDLTQGVKNMTKIANGMDNESVECDLRIANQIIDEAIRNEMRLSDVVRRIIELPVSHQESVHIPINLSDEDYALLAIRYGVSSSDKNAIRSRIVQDLGDFSGNGKKVSK